MLQVRHISQFAFWLANPFQYPTPQRDIVYQNSLTINILYSTSRTDIFQDRRTVFRAAAPNQNPQSLSAVAKIR